MRLLRKILLPILFPGLFIVSGNIYAQAVDACINIPGHTITNKTLTVCKGTVVNLTGNNCGTATNVSFQWQNVTYNPPPTLNIKSFPTSDSGKWVLRVRDNLGNTGYDTVHIKYNPSSPFAIHNDPELIFKCKNDQLILEATEGPEFSDYNWYLNEVNSQSIGNESKLTIDRVPGESAEYIVVSQDSYGCSVSDTIYVWELNSPPVNLGRDKDLCEGESVELSSPSTSGGIYTYMWNTGATTGSITVDEPGKYWFRAQGPFPFPCAATDTVLVNVTPKPRVDAGNDTTICFGTEVQLNAVITSEGTAPYSYKWLPDESLDQPNIAKPLASPKEETNYKLIVTDSGGKNGCKDSATVKVSVTPELKVEVAFSDTLICPNQEISLGVNASGGVPDNSTEDTYAYNWTPANILNNPNIHNPVASPASETTFMAVATDSFGCKDSAETVVRVSNLLVIIEEGDDAQICEGDSIKLNAIASAGQSPYSYSWFTEDNSSSSEGSTAYITPSSPGFIFVLATDGRNCQTKDSINISHNPLPMAIAGDDDNICEGTTTTLTGSVSSSTVGPYSYYWFPETDSGVLEGATQEVIPEVSQEYYFQVIDGRNCKSLFDTTKVVLIPKPFLSLGGLDTSACTGASISLIANYTDDNLSFQWRNNTENSSIGTENSIRVSEAGVYQLTVREPVNNCTTTVEKHVRYIETPRGVYISADTLFNVEVDYNLQAIATGEELTYTWSSTGDGFFTDKEENSIVYIPSDDDIGQITVSVIAENICGKVDTSMQVRGFKPIVPHYRSVLFIPNVFSPTSDDSDNQALKVFGENISPDGFVFEVFNRWGERVYHTTNFEEANTLGWSGQNFPMGVYTYVIKGKFNDGEEFNRTSNITLVR